MVTVAVSSYRYQSRRSDEPLRTRLVELAREKPRFGYRAAGLMIRRKKRKHCARVGQPLRVWTAAKQGRSIDPIGPLL